MTGTNSPETSVSKTASSTAFTRAPFKAAPLKLTPADPANCKISDNMADCCKTRCEVCGKTFSLVNMRSHTLAVHKMRITQYKEVYGPLNLLEEVWHACYLCGQLVLLDNDHLGSHIKSAHKIAEKTYKDQYIVSRYTQRSDKNTKAQYQDCEGNKRGDEKEMSKTRAGSGGKVADVVEGNPFVCKEKDCGMAFRWKSNLKRHNLLVHAKERNFSCPAPGCGKDFGTRANLERHMTIHGEQVSKIAPELETSVDRMTVNWQEENQAGPQSGSSGNGEMKKFAPQNIQISNKEEENKERWKEIVPEHWEDMFYPFLDIFYECAVPDCPDCEKLGML